LIYFILFSFFEPLTKIILTSLTKILKEDYNEYPLSIAFDA